MPRPTRPFWSLVDRFGECWLWTGYRHRQGYGFWHAGGVRHLAHRAAYEIAVGPIPDGLDILHSCDNPPCVRPSHLRPGTAGDNARDAVRRDRWHSQLTLLDVWQMCRDHHERHATVAVIAEQRSLNPRRVRQIVHGESWGYITGASRTPACCRQWRAA